MRKRAAPKQRTIECGNRKILNPATRRCVLVNGKIGSRVAAAALGAPIRALTAANSSKKQWVADERMRQMVQLVAPQHSMRPAARQLVQRILWPVLTRLAKASAASWEPTLREVLGPDLARYAMKEAERPGPQTFRLKGFASAKYKPVVRELTAAMEYLAMELIEVAAKEAKQMPQWYFIGPETVLLAASRDPALRVLLPK